MSFRLPGWIAINHMVNLIYQIGTQLQNSIGAHSLYALAAVLAVYVFIVFGRANSGR